MSVTMQGNVSKWLSDIQNLIALIALLASGFMTVIGYKVHAMLFEMKIPERLSVSETKIKDHEKRLDKIENKVFKIGGGQQ